MDAVPDTVRAALPELPLATTLYAHLDAQAAEQQFLQEQRWPLLRSWSSFRLLPGVLEADGLESLNSGFTAQVQQALDQVSVRSCCFAATSPP